MTHSDRNATDLLACASYFCVEGCNFLLVNFVKLGVHKPLRVHNVLFEELLVDLIVGVCLPNLRLIQQIPLAFIDDGFSLVISHIALSILRKCNLGMVLHV